MAQNNFYEPEDFDIRLDKITEAEVVPNFVERLTIGEDLINPDDSDTVIISAGAKLKDDIILNMIRTMDVSDINHLNYIKTNYTVIYPGSISATIEVPEGDYALYRIIQEKTGKDVTECFTLNGSEYTVTFDVPATHIDIYKAYFYLQ